MPILNKPDMNYGIWADGGNVERPSSEKVEEGWVIEKPLNETMNWLQNRQDRMLQYINERGIPEWDSRTEYPLDAYAARSGVIYRALSPSTDKDPTLNTNIWQIAFVSYSDFIDYAEKIDSIENDEGYLGLYVSKANPVMDAPCRGIEYNNTSNSSGFRFEQNTPIISKEGVDIAEFSGGTNPKDVVTHEQLALAIQNYKVGDIYITTADGNPRARLGYGTWERFAKGRTLVSFSDEILSSYPDWTKVAGTTYGAYTHKLTVAEMPSHRHKLRHGRDNGSTDNDAGTIASDTQQWSNTYIPDSSVETTGGDQPHNNVQPSIVVYMWKRVS